GEPQPGRCRRGPEEQCVAIAGLLNGEGETAGVIAAEQRRADGELVGREADDAAGEGADGDRELAAEEVVDGSGAVVAQQQRLRFEHDPVGTGDAAEVEGGAVDLRLRVLAVELAANVDADAGAALENERAGEGEP